MLVSGRLLISITICLSHWHSLAPPSGTTITLQLRGHFFCALFGSTDGAFINYYLLFLRLKIQRGRRRTSAANWQTSKIYAASHFLCSKNIKLATLRMNHIQCESVSDIHSITFSYWRMSHNKFEIIERTETTSELVKLGKI